MRLLFTVRAGLGSLHPLIPIARAAEDAGHDVAFASPRRFASHVERAGFRCHPAGLDGEDRETELLVPEMRGLTGRERAQVMWQRMFAGYEPAAMVPALLDIAARWPFDVVVRDDCEFGGCIAAESLGIPHAAVHTVAFRPHLYDLIREPLDQQRAVVGLDPDPEGVMPFRFLFLSPFPPGYRNPAVALPPTTHALRPVPFDRSGDEQLPAWVERLPHRITVYLTLGTIFNHHVSIIRAFLDGLRDQHVNLIVTVGRDQDPEQFGPQPSHIRIERYIPQTLLLPHCDAVVTHGGSGTVMAALNLGLPMVIVPISADQPENADRCVALGVARAVLPSELTPELARGAVRDVLRSESYRRAAKRMRTEMDGLPGPEHAVALLGRLAAEGRPLMSD
jgi:UDP:flavonoid glycosyltransferase YjiC (YdhE family)